MAQQKKRILVTGGLGFIGHHVVNQLAAQGHSTCIIDNETDYGVVPRNELLSLLAERRELVPPHSIFRTDIADTVEVPKIFQWYVPDVVIHLASSPRQKVVDGNPVVGSKSMVQGLLNLLETSAATQVKKFVYASSSMVYGDFKDDVTEDSACQPIGQYGILKLTGEWLTRDYTRRTGMAHTIIRPSAVYGPRDVMDRVVGKFFQAAVNDEVLKVNGANESLDFTFVDDLVNGIVGASLSERADNQTYNLTRGQARKILDAANLVVKLIGQGTVEVRNKDANFPSRGTLNINAACADFGYKPTIDIEQGFEIYYDWLKNSSFLAPQLSKW